MEGEPRLCPDCREIVQPLKVQQLTLFSEEIITILKCPRCRRTLNENKTKKFEKISNEEFYILLAFLIKNQAKKLRPTKLVVTKIGIALKMDADVSPYLPELDAQLGALGLVEPVVKKLPVESDNRTISINEEEAERIMAKVDEKILSRMIQVIREYDALGLKEIIRRHNELLDKFFDEKLGKISYSRRFNIYKHEFGFYYKRERNNTALVKIDDSFYLSELYKSLRLNIEILSQLRQEKRYEGSNIGAMLKFPVAGHIESVSVLSAILCSLLEKLFEIKIDRNKVIEMAQLHDYLEGLTRDIPKNIKSYIREPYKTFVNETIKIEYIEKSLKFLNKKSIELIKEFEKEKTLEARVVKTADLLDTVLEMLISARRYSLDSAKEHAIKDVINRLKELTPSELALAAQVLLVAMIECFKDVIPRGSNFFPAPLPSR